MSLAFLHGEVSTGGRTQDGSVGAFEGPNGNLRFADWLFRSKAAGIVGGGAACGSGTSG